MDKIPAWLLKILVGLGSILLLIVIINQLLNIKDNASSIADKHLVTISAQGKITAQPDQVEINASVLTNASTAQDAQTQNTRKMNNVISFVKAQGVDAKDIQTSGYNVYPNYDYRTGVQTITGYTANQTITLKVHDLAKTGPLLDGLTQNGANQIGSVQFTFSDPDALREQARELGLKNARDKAQKLAEAAGAHLGSLVNFTEDQNSGYPVPIPFDARAAVGVGAAPQSTPVPVTEPGSQDITANVTVTYSLK